MAKDAMLEMGMKKKDRRDKRNVDEIAATIILQRNTFYPVKGIVLIIRRIG